jgi:hypothetical protein
MEEIDYEIPRILGIEDLVENIRTLFWHDQEKII